MKTMLSPRSHHYLARVSTFLIAAALVAGMAGCPPPAPAYNLTMASTTGGNVTIPGEGAFIYDEGTVVDLVAEADACYAFISWTGDVLDIASVEDASTNITMSGNYSITANFEREEAVTFEDSNLESAVREAIGKPTGDICQCDLTYLDASESNITNLTGLERCTSLVVLRLWNNQIVDISPLANLTSLMELYLWSNQIIDISPLANLTGTSLIFVALENNQIIDISPLANLTSLMYLTLENNQIIDISPLVENEGLGTGDVVDLQGNPLSSDSINIYIPELQARGVIVYY